MVGPDFAAPEAPIVDTWVQADGQQVRPESGNYRTWWTSLGDSVLDRLIDTAYRQNLGLQVAGVRVVEARAQLGIAVGDLYPQTQQGFGSLGYQRLSERAPTAPQPGAGTDRQFAFSQGELGITASWEIDLWGKFRRAIQSADASLIGTIADYDDVLVSLTADVATFYVQVRTFEERLRIARENVIIQRDNLTIAETRFRAGATSERDVQQAVTLLRSTEATIPELQTALTRAKHALSILLGLPPSELADMLEGPQEIPNAPDQVAVGIPAELLRRRPDVRRAELDAAAQSALIGVAKADLYPAFSLSGSFGFLSTDVGAFDVADIFLIKSRTGSIGPALRWDFLNYGRITNTVRVQDARLQQALIGYQNTVLRAQQEVEDSLVGFLKSRRRVALQQESAAAAKRSVDLASLQYREGATDFTTVLTAQQSLLSEQDNLVITRGDVVFNLIDLFRALGGGWEIREGQDLVPAQVRQDMAKRTDWGGLLSPEALPTIGTEPREHRAPVVPPDW